MHTYTKSESRNIFWTIIRISVIVITLLQGNKSKAAIIYDKEHSPYYLNSTLTIGVNDTLIILQGTTIIIDTAVDIVVYGTMFILGTADEPVNIFPKVDTVGWGRIYLLKPGAYCRFEYANIVDGTVLSLDVNLTYRDVHFINRQNLPLHFNVTRIERASADLQNCSVKGTGKGEGFLLMNMTGAIIRNCKFYNIPDAIEISKLSDSRISNNIIVNAPDDALDLNNCTDVTVDSNIIIHAHDRGMEIGSEIFGSSTNITVFRNLIINCKEGIVFKEGSSGIIRNNTLFQNKIGIVSKEIGPAPGGSQVTVENTIISQSVWRDTETDSLSELLISYSLSDTEQLDGFANLFSDPQFTDPENDDFSLQESSLCIDAGNPDSPPDPDGTISDIGAFFFMQDTSSSIISIEFAIQSVSIYPNPFTSVLNVKFHLPFASEVVIELYSVGGRKVRSMVDKTLMGGDYTITFNIRDGKPIKAGFYVCVVSFDNVIKGFKVVQVK